MFSVGGWFGMGFGFVVWLAVGLIWILLCLQVAGLVSGCCFVFVVVVVICFWSCVVWVFGICDWLLLVCLGISFSCFGYVFRLVCRSYDVGFA